MTGFTLYNRHAMYVLLKFFSCPIFSKVTWTVNDWSISLMIFCFSRLIYELVAPTGVRINQKHMFSSTEITDFPKLRSSTCAVNQTGLWLAIEDRLPSNKWDFNSRVSLAICGHYLLTLVLVVAFFLHLLVEKRQTYLFLQILHWKNFFFLNVWLHLGYGVKLESWQKTRK